MGDDTASRLERTISDFRTEVARDMGSVMARLDTMKDHDGRLRHLEQTSVTREELKEVLREAIANGRRLSWKDLGLIITTTGAGASAVAALVTRLAG